MIGCTGDDLCPVVATLAYLALRGGNQGPLFQFKDGSPLTQLSERSRRHSRVWDTHPRDIQDTVFVQGLHPQQLQQGWKTRLLRQWGGGRVQLTCYILEYHETSSGEYHQCCPRSRSVTYSIILLYRDTFFIPSVNHSIGIERSQ